MSDTLPSSQRPVIEKCKQVTKTYAVYCTAMKQALSAQNPHGKGLSEFVVWEELDTPKPSTKLIGLLYRETSKAPGIMLNLCPWCGESLKWWPDQDKKDKKEKING